MKILEYVEKIDETLSNWEDYFHGQEGIDVTEARANLDKIRKQLTLTDVGCSKNKEQALARLKILKDINNEYESNELEVSNKFFLKELKKHITNAFWHGWNL